jgi:hypothetical protein
MKDNCIVLFHPDDLMPKDKEIATFMSDDHLLRTINMDFDDIDVVNPIVEEAKKKKSLKHKDESIPVLMNDGQIYLKMDHNNNDSACPILEEPKKPIFLWFAVKDWLPLSFRRRPFRRR